MVKKMKIEGMSCGHCSARVEKALNALVGVKAVVNLEEKCAEITLDREIGEESLRAAVTEAGYEAVSIEESA